MNESKRAQAIELLARGDLNYEVIAAKLDVAVTTLRAWRRQPDFTAAVHKRATELLKQAIPPIYNILVDKSIQGKDLAAIRLLLERVDRAEEDIVKTASGNITFTWRRKQDGITTGIEMESPASE